MTNIIDGKVIGPIRGAKILKKWVPKEWRPEYEAIVALSCTGLSNEEVGKRFGFGPQHVSNILNTPQGKKLKELIQQNLRTHNVETYAERIETLKMQALKRIEDVITDDEKAESSPLAIFDRSLALLKTTGALQEIPAGGGTSGNTFIGRALIVSDKAAGLISEGLQKSERMREIHSDNGIGKLKP